MNRHGTFTLLVGALLLAGCARQEPSRSARRPIHLFEFRRLPEVTDHQRELVTTKFHLLERAETCSDMGLSQEQSNAVRRVYETPYEQIPGLTEFRAQQKAARQKADLTQQERASLNFATGRGMGRIWAQFSTQQLQAILSPRQGERLEQLVLQARGPLMLVIDTNLAAALKLSPEQMQRMRDVQRLADEKMDPVFHEFLRGFLAPFSANETAATREREMSALIPRLRRMIGKRDKSILRILTPEQNDQFKARQGSPLSIQWDPWDCLKGPFEKEDS
jgi:LTXXQ motif family protein